MESNSNEQIVNLVEQVIILLSDNNEQEWAKFLRNALINFNQSEDKAEAVTPIMKSMLGGMGTLSDVVLHKDKKPLIDENNKLYYLLNELYDECKKLQ